jgi:hypothetical protein
MDLIDIDIIERDLLNEKESFHPDWMYDIQELLGHPNMRTARTCSHLLSGGLHKTIGP